MGKTFCGALGRRGLGGRFVPAVIIVNRVCRPRSTDPFFFVTGVRSVAIIYPLSSARAVLANWSVTLATMSGMWVLRRAANGALHPTLAAWPTPGAAAGPALGTSE